MKLTAMARWLIGAGAALACGAAPAYEQAGHFYTAFALARTAAPSLPERDLVVVAFCAQLPDMASDLDAVAVYARVAKGNPWHWLRWASADVIGSADLRRMVTIQHLLHGLTGGRADAVQAVARRTVQTLRAQVPAAGEERDAALCALGFGLHLQGDSFAHEQLDHAGLDSDQRRMYVTGRGHAADWHDPDHVYCTRYVATAGTTARRCVFDAERPYRFEYWRTLWTDEAAVIDGVLSQARPIDRKQVLDRVVELGKDAAAYNQWNEKDMRSVLLREAAREDLERWIGSMTGFIERYEKDQKPCEAVLEDAVKERVAPLFPGLHASCAVAWARYESAARREFEASKDSRATLDTHPDFEREVYCRRPLDKQSC